MPNKSNIGCMEEMIGSLKTGVVRQSKTHVTCRVGWRCIWVVWRQASRWHLEFLLSCIHKCYLMMLMGAAETNIFLPKELRNPTDWLSFCHNFCYPGERLPVTAHPAELVLQKRGDGVHCVPPAARPSSPLAVLCVFLHCVVGFRQKP